MVPITASPATSAASPPQTPSSNGAAFVVAPESCEALTYGADGKAGPATCPDGRPNMAAVKYDAAMNSQVLTLGANASLGQVETAICADRAGRPALALDLMECARGVVERTVLGLAQGRTFAKRDFTELATGEVRLVAPLTHDLATALLPALREAIAPVAEHLASELAGVALTEVRVPTALTGARRRAARAERGDVVRSRRGTASPTAQLWTCPSCGKQVTERRHVRCAACIAADPGQNATVRGVRGAAISAAKTRQAAWTRAGGAGEFDPGAWPAILDGLTGVKLADIVAATGLSKSFACTVRAGRHRPHLSHWPALAALAGRGELVATTGPAGRRQARTGAHGTGALR